MIQINKQGNAIVIEFTDNDKYLFDGTIEIAPNELMVVVDESNMATFKRVSNGDTLFAQRVEDIQINGVTAAKDTVIDLFGSIGYTSGGGSGTGAVSSVNGQTGDVVITAAGLGAMTKAQADAAYQAKGDYALKSEIPSIEGLATKEELEEKLEVFQVNAPMAFSRDEATQDLHLSIDLSNLATKEELNDKQDTLVSGENIKTVNGESILGNGNIVIKETIDAELNAESENPVQNKVITSSLEGKADSSTVESLSTEIATVSTNVANLTTKVNEDSDKIASLDTEMGNKQATLVSGTNIKTINNESILGSGNIEIQGGEETFEVYRKITNPSSPEAELNKKVYDVIKSGVYPKVYISWDESELKTSYVSVEVKTNSVRLSFPYIHLAESRLINQLWVDINSDGTSSEGFYSTKNIYDVTGSYLTNSNGIVEAKQIDIETSTDLGEGFADSYDVKKYILNTFTVDKELSTESINPVQNKIITAALDGKQAVGDYALKSEIPDTSSLATKTELNNVSQEVEHKADKTSVYTMDEVNTKLATKQATLVAGANITLSDPDTEGKVTITATQPDISGITTTVEELTGEVATLSTDKQDNLVSGTNIKTINGESILGSGNIVIQGGGGGGSITVDTEMSDTSENPVLNKVINSALNGKANLTDLTAKQDTLVSGTNIKTIDGDSILGEGNIESYIKVEAPTDTDEKRAHNLAIFNLIKSGKHPRLILDYNNKTFYAVSTELMLMGEEDGRLSIVFTDSFANYSQDIYSIDINGLDGNTGTPETANTNVITRAVTLTNKEEYLDPFGIGSDERGRMVYLLVNSIETSTTLDRGVADAYDVKLYVDAHTVTVDTEMSDTSENAVQNKIIKNYVDSHTVTVDTAMSDTSENAVQNKVIKAYIDNIVGNILTKLQEINGNNQ